MRHESASKNEERVCGVCLSKMFAIELTKSEIKFRQEVEMCIYYDETLVGKRRLDFLVEEVIAVEIKAICELTDAHLAQGINYLETQGLEIGL